MTTNIDRLEELARKAKDHSPGPGLVEEYQFQIAASPDVVLALCKVARAAQKIATSKVFNDAPFAGYSEAFSDLKEALAELEARDG